MIIGITGSFGSGKTTVANMFSKYGFKVINVDKLYHGIYNKNKILKIKIKKEFGTLNRDTIKRIVFNDHKTRKNGTFFVSQKSSISVKLIKLNRITHPIILKEIKNQISTIIKRNIKKNTIIKIKNNKIINKNKKLENKIKIIIDIPLLFESKLEKMFDKIIVVKCSKKEQIKRVLKTKKYTKEEIENIIESQMPLKEKIKRADFVVDNDKTIKNTQYQIINIITKTLKTNN